MCVFSQQNANAAFVINKVDTKHRKTGMSKLLEEPKMRYTDKVKKSVHDFLTSGSDYYHDYEYEKKLWLAAVLSFPSFGGMFGIGRFYLGYNWQGLLQLAVPLLALLFYIFFKLSSSGFLFPFYYTFTLGFIFMVLWEIVDTARILLGTLRPRYGGWL